MRVSDWVFEPPERRSGKCVTVRRAVRRVLALHNHLEAYPTFMSVHQFR